MTQYKTAGYAASEDESLGREYPESFKDSRPSFERDRDRIIHCGAFRRLEYKTQVFVNHEGDYYRTRLTHSIEVAQISRGIAKMLGLQVELAEALALAHDLGHTPFGHSGEETLQELMESEGGFEHNHQSLRVVTVLEERYPKFPGLNLSFETREGIVKHSTYYDHPDPNKYTDYHPEWKPTLEAQLINHSDVIAYINHDLDDGLESGLLHWDELCKIEIWDRMLKQVAKRHGIIDRRYQKTMAISHLIGFFIEDLVSHSNKVIAERGIKTMRDVREADDFIATLSGDAEVFQEEIRAFLYKRLYRHHHLERRRFQAQNTIRMLFNAYNEHPKMMPERYEKLIDQYGVKRVICDYIAGMTDRYALQEYAQLFETPKGP